MKIGIAGLHHETNTFALEQNDTMDTVGIQRGEALLAAHPKNFIGGFVEGAKRDDVELVPTVNAGSHSRNRLRSRRHYPCRSLPTLS